jgi:hypothetical protein
MTTTRPRLLDLFCGAGGCSPEEAIAKAVVLALLMRGLHATFSGLRGDPRGEA